MEKLLCPRCHSSNIEKNGTRNGQRYHCKNCDKYFGESTNRIPIETQFIAVWFALKGKIPERVIAKALNIKSHYSVTYWENKCSYDIDSLNNESKAKVINKAKEMKRKYNVLCEYNDIRNKIISINRGTQYEYIPTQNTPITEGQKAEIEQLRKAMEYLKEQEKMTNDADDSISIRKKLQRIKVRYDYLQTLCNQPVYDPTLIQCRKEKNAKIKANKKERRNELTQKLNEIEKGFWDTFHQSAYKYTFYSNEIMRALNELLQALEK